MRTKLAIALALLLATPAFAEEPRGCDKFAWPLDAEKAALTSSDKQTASTGTEFDRASTTAIAMPLLPMAEAKLVMPPERAPKKPDSFAGSVAFAASAASGTYRITLSDAGWIDVIQGGAYLKPTAFTGALDCPGVRKSVAFALGADPFTLQVSDVAAPGISVVITPSK